MSIEIKEILDKLNNKAKHYILYDYEVKQLLDYITNLQTIEQQYCPLLSENADLQQRIDKQKEEYEDRIKYLKEETDPNINYYEEQKIREME